MSLPGRVVPAAPRPAEFARGARSQRSTTEQRQAAGRAARTIMPLADHADLGPGDRDPVALLEEQAATRVQRLIPIRYGRMLASPLTFLRGAARLMAVDLGAGPDSGLRVQLCGDAHLSNFGFYATPERQQAFDINDFDETHPGPFEWDVKRLAASVAIATLVNGFAPKKARTAALAAAAGYRTEMNRLAGLGTLAVWYAHQDVDGMLTDIRSEAGDVAAEQLGSDVARARFHDSNHALRKLCTTVEGQVQFRNDPPLIVPAEELLPAWGQNVDDAYDLVGRLVRAYRRGLQSDRRYLFDQFTVVQLGFKLVGVGSVGTRAYVVLLDGSDAQDPLILQAKEAQPSVLADQRPAPTPRPADEGNRVVHGQRLLQMTSDIFLGAVRATGIDGARRDYYVRQLRDGKGSVDVDRLRPRAMAFYARVCGQTLARAHARSGDRVAIAGYLGSAATFDEAIADFALAYADRSVVDHAALRQAAADGRIAVREGV
ncbi:DUF2252 domain-containing protein [Nakamurella multipartita]|uniref:DUF2252 domain-containing protein n=1 Tax=Nakamurella multipartita (strain ATCC 700099 / DSM 44233 / CIP 104796 / JCM 9543 / NBRC 105858 / Y-104) TaxID=479431 RepID=C8X820_NAKMY|nr:DUF2252 domain-containing protein [Nakamurella multipartita]ACV81023.1 hypothetical protein Namu_4747 [Nakamurella multipartita DSM 44233]